MMSRLKSSMFRFLTTWLLSSNYIFSSVYLVRAQNRTGTTTHPDDGRALNSIFNAWENWSPSEWNISSELCSGIAIDDRVSVLYDTAYNPLIKCNCTFNDSQISRVTALDLSLNKLHGPIPASPFTLIHLTHLDVSYKDLFGSFLSWVSQSNFKLILSGLICVQKNFAYNRGKVIYFSFSINGEDHALMLVRRTLFEKENTDLGPASFFVSADHRRGTSNVEIFYGKSNDKYKYINTSKVPISNTLYPEIFGSAQISESSFRYYGLGLENRDYTVKLQFVEIQIVDSFDNPHTSLGRGRFDTNVQERLVEKEFDVHRMAGDSSLRAVKREYKRNVSDNYFEVHAISYGKAAYCSFDLGTNGSLISTINAKQGNTNDFIQNMGSKPPSKRNYKTDTIVLGAIIGVVLLSILVFVVMFIIRKRRKRCTDDKEILNMDVKPYTLTYSELKSATQNFNPSNKLGEGGFGCVYKGNLNDGREVAVKQLSSRSRHGNGQFVAEIIAISSVLHRNLVKLYGCCFEGEHRLLVYEYLSNGSLDKALFGYKTLHLDWSTRFQICLGVAKGLSYLHEEASVCIVHRDIKASNILLDSKFVPKVSDFGLAKLYDDTETHITTQVAGTVGYLAPEYAMRGHLTEKVDVYAFGVVALELVSGRKNFEETLEMEKKYLLEWACNLHEKGRDIELIDDELSEYNIEEVKRIIGVALLCTQTSHALRPPMSRVVNMLLGDVEVNDVTSKKGYPIYYTFADISSSSFSNFQTKGTSFSTSFVKHSLEILPGDTGPKPMLGFNINEGR